MSDLDTYVSHCYDLLLKGKTTPEANEELPACEILIEHEDGARPKTDYQEKP